MRIALAIAVVALVGCHRHRDGTETFPLVPGLAIACFQPAIGTGYAVVDDRRELVVDRDHRVTVVGLAPDVSLASLAFEGLPIGACTRDGLGHDIAPIVTCTTPASPGRHLVRLLYTSAQFAVRTLHEVAVTADATAIATTLRSQYAIATPIWQRRASIVVYDGAPGLATPAREVARGEASLDGSVAILGAPARAVTARLVRVYEGAIHDATTPPSVVEGWAAESQDAVWVWLELETTLSHGPVFARVIEDGEVHEIDVTSEGRHDGARVLRLPLWIDRDLRGGRTRTARSTMVDHITMSLTNVGPVARDVWFEEPLRPHKVRKIEDAEALVTVVGTTAVRVKRRVEAGDADRAWFTIRYAD